MKSNSFQTLKERTFARLAQSIQGLPSDHHSVFHYYTYPFYHNVTGVDLKRYYQDPRLMMETQLSVMEKLEGCGSLQPDVGSVAESSALGGAVRFDPNGFISVHETGIESEADLAAMKPGDPEADNYMRTALDALQYMLENAPDGVKVNPPICMGPFTIGAQLRGISDFCMDTLEDPDFVSALLELTVETCINYIAAAEKRFRAPLHHVMICDDISAFMSEPAFRAWVMPTYAAIMKRFPQTQFWLHNDAKAFHLAEAISESGFSGWQYAPDIPAQALLEKTGGRLSLFGGLNPVELQNLSPEQVYAASMDRLRSFEGNTRCVLGVGGSVNQIPVANLLAMLRAADDYVIPAESRRPASPRTR